ncbi:hypothetical protein ACFQGS_23215 [Novosphingobium lubricantis]
MIRSRIALDTLSGIVPSAMERGRMRLEAPGSETRRCDWGRAGSSLAPRLSARRESCSAQGRSGARFSTSVIGVSSARGDVAASMYWVRATSCSGPSPRWASKDCTCVQSCRSIAPNRVL